jgi:hypothetical protein
MENKIDWIIHYVFSDENEPDYLADVHTHGLENHGHPELRIVLAFPDDICNIILNDVGVRILNGERFDKEGTYRNIIKNDLPVKILKEKIGNQETMVLIFPDKNGLLPDEEGCENPFSEQLELIEYIKKNRY